ncbi:hypothetical protein PaeBR_17695 [Paenibacillus sp. BR2-3]
MFEDESMIRDYQALQKTWFAKGYSKVSFKKMKIGLNLYFSTLQPELNLVEGLWKWLKADVINNVFYHTTSEIRKNAGTFMDNIMKDPMKIIDRLCIRM